MINFVIGVYSAPGSPGAHAAYQFAQTALKKKHMIAQIFFYEAGIQHADIPTEFLKLNKKIKLAVCSSLKPKPTQKQIKPISLTQYIYAVINTDRHVIFK